MKTTIEIPDNILVQIKTMAAEQGFSFREFTIQALLDRLTRSKQKNEKPWLKAFGALHHLHHENILLQSEINQEFNQIDLESWK